MKTLAKVLIAVRLWESLGAIAIAIAGAAHALWERPAETLAE